MVENMMWISFSIHIYRFDDSHDNKEDLGPLHNCQGKIKYVYINITTSVSIFAIGLIQFVIVN